MVELSSVQVEDVENPHSGPTTASTTNSTFNYARDIVRGRAFDNIFVERLWRNVKHEDVYLKGYATMEQLMLGLAEYFVFYNDERPHQSLEYKTPSEVYRSAIGGGALIVDKFPRAVEQPPVQIGRAHV